MGFLRTSDHIGWYNIDIFQGELSFEWSSWISEYALLYKLETRLAVDKLLKIAFLNNFESSIFATPFKISIGFWQLAFVWLPHTILPCSHLLCPRRPVARKPFDTTISHPLSPEMDDASYVSLNPGKEPDLPPTKVGVYFPVKSVSFHNANLFCLNDYHLHILLLLDNMHSFNHSHIQCMISFWVQKQLKIHLYYSYSIHCRISEISL